MKKSKMSVAGLEGEDRQILFEPNSLFGILQKQKISIPKYASVIMFYSRPEKGSLSILFYENKEEFFGYYTKFLVTSRHPDGIIVCYEKQGNVWSVSNPPTLIGLNLETKLRMTGEGA